MPLRIVPPALYAPLVAATLVCGLGISSASQAQSYGYSAAHSTRAPVAETTTGSTRAPAGSQSTPRLHHQSTPLHYGSQGDQAPATPPISRPDPDPVPGPGTGPAPTPGPADGQTVVHVTISSTRTTADNARVVTFGQVFARGDLPAGTHLVAQANGQPLATQVDRKAVWGDDSLRHAVITVALDQRPGPNGVSLALVRTSQAPRTADDLALSDLLATDFDARIQFQGAVGQPEADARSLLEQAERAGGCPAWARTCKQWLSGPLVSEWIVGGPLDGDRGDHLAVYFNVRAYGDGQGHVARARVDTVVENDWAYVPDPHNLHYHATLSVGGNRQNLGPLTHYHQARWHRVAWWNGNPALYAQIDTDYLQSTGAISRYAAVQPTDNFLDSRPTHFPLLTHGDQTPQMGQTGAQAAIGPLPLWSTVYAVTGDRRAFEWMTANDDAVGTYGFHYRDAQTGRPLTITDHPYVTLANYSYASRAGGKLGAALLPACHGDCHSPVDYDIAHQPSIGYLPYLVTGDYYYLEEMQFAAAYDELWTNQAYREHDRGILRNALGQVRAQAWALRDISDAAFATPDADPMKTYFTGLVDHILTDYNNFYVGTGVNPLHTLVGGEAIRYPRGSNDRVAIAPWQTDFFTWAVGHADEQGFAGARPFLNWLAPWQIQRMIGWETDADDGFCWLEASAYTLRLRDTRHSPIYADMDAVYRHSFPQLVGTRCNSDAMRLRAALSTGESLDRDEMSGFAGSPTGFPANFQIGLAHAVDADVPGGAEAWRLFAGRSHVPDYDNAPTFDVIPRRIDD